MNFLWHDYETFGRMPRIDRPAQFAAVRTDAELNEIEAPVTLYCRPAPDYLPDPESCLLTGITPQFCLAQGVPEHEFAKRIEVLFTPPDTVGVGYNTIRFDDEVTRFLFWRNLIDPYAREWQNGCGRWDLLDVVRATWALRPEGIEWPMDDKSLPTFKLEALTHANGLTHDAAHDALSDVRATIALAKLIKSKQPRLWDFCLRLRSKHEVLKEIGVGRPFLHVSGMYGAAQGCMAVVWPLAPHPTNKNEIIVWDLRHDPEVLFSLGLEDIRTRLFTKQADLPEGTERLPIKTIHLNRSPIVISQLKTLTAPRAQAFAIDVPTALRHAEVLQAKGAKLAGVWSELFVRPETEVDSVSSMEAEQNLYGGFLGEGDRRTLQRLRALATVDWGNQRQPIFVDERLDDLVFRFRARNFPDLLMPQETKKWEQYRAAKLHHGYAGALTLSAFFERIDALNEQANEAGQEILSALYEYAESIAPTYEGACPEIITPC
jgi:exodeoxyribonuclease-1